MFLLSTPSPYINLSMGNFWLVPMLFYNAVRFGVIKCEHTINNWYQ